MSVLEVGGRSGKVLVSLILFKYSQGGEGIGGNTIRYASLRNSSVISER